MDVPLLQNGSRYLIFSIAMGAKYLSYVKSIATFALTFLGYIISVLASVKTIGTETWNKNLAILYHFYLSY